MNRYTLIGHVRDCYLWACTTAWASTSRATTTCMPTSNSAWCFQATPVVLLCSLVNQLQCLLVNAMPLQGQPGCPS